MKRLLVGLLLLAGLAHADTLTTNAGLTIPDIGSPGWGVKTNSNWEIIDSSFAVLSATQTFSADQTFTGEANLNNDVNFCSGNNCSVLVQESGFLNLSIDDGSFLWFTGTGGSSGNSSVLSNLYCTGNGPCYSYADQISKGSGSSTGIVYGFSPTLTCTHSGANDMRAVSLTPTFAGTTSAIKHYGIYLAPVTTTTVLSTNYGISINPVDISTNAAGHIGLNVDLTDAQPAAGGDRISGRFFDGQFQVKGSTRTSYSILVGTSTSLSSTDFHLGVSTTGAVQMKGTSLADNASVGFYGEYVSSTTTAFHNFPTSGNYGDLLSLSLTAGDWDVSAIAFVVPNGATVTRADIGISETSGNSSTGLDYGRNAVRTDLNAVHTPSIPAHRMSLSSTTTIYLKYRANYSAATPQVQGARLSARRVR